MVRKNVCSKHIRKLMNCCFVGLLTVPWMVNYLQAQVVVGSLQPPKEGSLLELNENVLDPNNPDVNSTQGIALPRVGLQAANSLQPAVPNHNAGDPNSDNLGLMVYNVSSLGKAAYVWNGNAWEKLITDKDMSSNNASWGLTGNAGTNSSNNFLGTTDNQALEFKVNATHAGNISNSTTVNNNSFGLGALASNTGADNDAFGYNALNANTNGTGNVAFGNKVLGKSTGNNNTAVGNTAAADNGAGSTNTTLGFQSGKGLSTGSNNIAIGANTPLDNAGSNKMNIGNVIFARDLSTDGSIAGEVGIGTSTPMPAAALDVSSANKGVIFPRIDLKGVNDKNTIPQPPTGLFVFNTHDGDGLVGNTYYYNSGNGDNPVWTMLQPFNVDSGARIAKKMWVGDKPNVTQDLTMATVGRFVFAIGKDGNGAPIPQVKLAANPGKEIKAAFHMGEYWERNGYSYTSDQSKTFNSSNWNNYQNITSSLSTTERNEFWTAYPGDRNLYRCDFLVMGTVAPYTFGVVATMY